MLPLAMLLVAPDFRAVDAYVEKTGGESVIVSDGKKTIHAAYFRDRKPADMVHIASGSKSFWGILAVRLEQAGKLRLSDRIGDVLPTYKDRPTTIRDVLNLTSGLPAGNRAALRRAMRTPGG